jgi:hypothetical protein
MGEEANHERNNCHSIADIPEEPYSSAVRKGSLPFLTAPGLAAEAAHLKDHPAKGAGKRETTDADLSLMPRRSKRSQHKAAAGISGLIHVLGNSVCFTAFGFTNLTRLDPPSRER